MKQKEMFAMVEAWRESGMTKQLFVNEHPITYHKLNYWIGRYNKLKQAVDKHPKSNFHQICLSAKNENRSQMVLELTTPAGTHITIYG